MKKMSGNRVLISGAALPRRQHYLVSFFELTKIHLSLYIALSSVFGHVLSQNRFSMESIKLGGFVLILTAGSAVLNHIQDRRFDSWFSRTRHRCLVQKKISPCVAGVFAAGLILIGLGGLFGCFQSLAPVGLGLLALVCYNGFYTPLKKRWLGAIVPGTLCGMLPPAMGWVAVPKQMGVADESGILMVMLIFGLWQIPHFFIILLKQVSAELEASPYPFFTCIFSPKEIRGQILIWTSLYSLGIFLFLLRGWIHSFDLSLALGASALGLPFLMAALLRGKQNFHSLSLGFFAINLSMLFFMGLGILDRI